MDHPVTFAILQLFLVFSPIFGASYYAHNFHDLLTKPHFIDKSEFIKEIFSSKSSKTLLSSPRGFGKTVNLQMLQTFLEIELDEYGVPIHPKNTSASKIFANLTISKYPEIVNHFMAKHPVLFLDLYADPVLDFQNKDEIRNNIVRHVNTKVCDSFAKHSWLLQIPAEVLKDHYGINGEMIDFMSKLYQKDLDNVDNKDEYLHKMLYDICVILRSYYRSSVVILVDNYDSMVSNSFKPPGEGILTYYHYVNSMLQKAFETVNADPVAGGVIMGTSGLVLASLRTYLSQTEYHPFMGEESKFNKYFGFEEKEVVQLLDRFNCQSHLSNITSYYNGYKTIYQDISIYNPSSVVKYLENLDNDPLRVYWSTSIVDNFFLSFSKDELLRKVAGTVANNGTTGYHMAETYTSETYHLFFELCQNHKYEKTDQSLVLWFLYDHGYLSHRIVQTEPSGQFLDAMGAPNYETRQAIETLLGCKTRFVRVRKASNKMLSV